MAIPSQMGHRPCRRLLFSTITFLSVLTSYAQVTYFSPQAGPPTYYYNNQGGGGQDARRAGVDPQSVYNNGKSRSSNEQSYVRYQYATPDTPVYYAPPSNNNNNFAGTNGAARNPAPGDYEAGNIVYTVPSVVPAGGGAYVKVERSRQPPPSPGNYYDNRRDPRRRYDDRRRGTSQHLQHGQAQKRKLE